MSKFDKFKKLNRKEYSKIQVGGFRPSNDPFTTNFAKSVVSLPGETWPTFNGEPLTFICQINLENAPYKPEILKDIKIITFFIDLDSYLTQGEPEGSWCLRAYKEIDKLVQLDIPKSGIKHKGFECRFEFNNEDYPIYDDLELTLPENFSDEDLDDFYGSLEFIHSYDSKIGGWPSNIQHEPQWCHSKEAEPKFCLQIASEEKANLMWVDNGFVYIARGTNKGFRDDWFIDIQFY